MNPTKSNRIPIRDLTYIAFFTTLIIMCSWIRIPFVIPFTLQSFGICLAVGLLGGKRATLSIALYILLGAIGLPVFSGFVGGIGTLFGATGGYIFGFLLTPLIKLITEYTKLKQAHGLALSLALGLLLCYCFGTAWYLYLYTEGFHFQQLASVLGICVAPFLLPDILKLLLAWFLTKKLKKYIK